MRDRVLVVDDDLAIRKLIFWGLSEFADVEEAGDAETAMAALRRVRPGVVTLDLRLTGPHCEQGMELIPLMLAEDPCLKIVMVTADVDDTNATRAIELGAWDYVVKPIETEELRVIVRRAAHVYRLQRASAVAPIPGPAPSAFEEWLGVSDAAARVGRLLRTLATEREPVLIVGEPGTGRELAAHALHDLGSEPDAPFVRIRSRTALPEPGTVIAGSTLFLDDVSSFEEMRLVELPEWMSRVSDSARVVASAPSDIGRRVQMGGFPDALYHYLGAMTALLPPLRDRFDDIDALSDHLLSAYALRFNPAVTGLEPDARLSLNRHRWPGNYRELERRILGGVLASSGPLVTEEDIWPGRPLADGGGLKQRLGELERVLVERALRSHEGNVSRAAKALDVSRPTLHALLRKHGIDPDQYRVASNA